MATKTTAIVVDDIDGSTDDVGTYQFAFNGVTYEIDLSGGNFDRMAAAFGPFITAGRRLPKQPRAPRRQQGTATGRTQSQEIRTWWWTANWQELNLPRPRTGGVIPATVRDAYHAAHLPPVTSRPPGERSPGGTPVRVAGVPHSGQTT